MNEKKSKKQNPEEQDPKKNDNSTNFEEINELDELFEEIAKVEETDIKPLSEKREREEIVESDELEIKKIGSSESLGNAIQKELEKASKSNPDLNKQLEIKEFGDDFEIPEVDVQLPIETNDTIIENEFSDVDLPTDAILKDLPDENDDKIIDPISIEENCDEVKKAADSATLLEIKAISTHDLPSQDKLKKNESFNIQDKNISKDHMIEIEDPDNKIVDPDQLEESAEDIIISKKSNTHTDRERIKKQKDFAEKEVFVLLDAQTKRGESKPVVKENDSQEILFDNNSQKLENDVALQDKKNFGSMPDPEEAKHFDPEIGSDLKTVSDEIEDKKETLRMPEISEIVISEAQLSAGKDKFSISEESKIESPEKLLSGDVEQNLEQDEHLIEDSTEKKSYAHQTEEYKITLADLTKEKISIGEVLENEGLVTLEEFNEELKDEELLNSPIVQEITSAGMPNRKDLHLFLSQNYKMPKVNLQGVKIDKEALKVIPEFVAKKYSILPILRIGKIICVATSEFFDFEALKELREATGFKIKFLFAPAEKILKALEIVYQFISPKQDKSERFNHSNKSATGKLSDVETSSKHFSFEKAAGLSREPVDIGFREDTEIFPNSPGLLDKTQSATKIFQDEDLSELDLISKGIQELNIKLENEDYSADQSQKMLDDSIVEEIDLEDLEPITKVPNEMAEDNGIADELLTDKKSEESAESSTSSEQQTSENSEKKIISKKKTKKKKNPLDVLGLTVDLDKTLSEEEINEKQKSNEPKPLLGAIPSDASPTFISEVIGSIDEKKTEISAEKDIPDTIDMTDEEVKKANIEKLRNDEAKLSSFETTDAKNESEIIKTETPIVSDVNIPAFSFGKGAIPEEINLKPSDETVAESTESSRKRISKVKRKVTSAIRDGSSKRTFSKRTTENIKKNIDLSTSMDSDKGDSMLFLQPEVEKDVEEEIKKLSETDDQHLSNEIPVDHSQDIDQQNQVPDENNVKQQPQPEENDITLDDIQDLPDNAVNTDEVEDN